jgi:endonuclease/exonuclease/phosphatase family metal-dependent hydrolase
VFSRIPADIAAVDLLGVPMGVVTLEVGRPIELLAVHTLPPRTAELAQEWQAQMRLLADWPCDILAGDLNATRHHPSYRRLLAAGLRDAHAEVGRASASTWPMRAFPLPPMRLDHVLVGDGIGVAAVWELPANGSDHAPVVADLRVLPE